MFPQSSHKGQAVMGFPDVCKTPVPMVGAVPMPYPNVGMTSATKMGTKTATKTTTSGVAMKASSFGRTSGDEGGALLGHLSIVHNQLMKARPGDATQWHKLVDEYVLTAARAFETLSR